MGPDDDRVGRPVADRFHGSRAGWLRDPFGHRWNLATPLTGTGERPADQTLGVGPIEPPETSWDLPVPPVDHPGEIVAIGADLEPGTVLAAYRRGLFPMKVGRRRTLGWWSPDPRGIVPVDGLHVSRSLRRSRRRFEVRLDTAFEQVMRACADPRRPAGWIDDDFVRAYATLHELGWTHSVETWIDDELVGGLYGVAVGGLFAGESMFHRVTDASKVALVATVEHLGRRGFTLFDVQWVTPHLASMGAVEVRRAEYHRRLDAALAVDPTW
jgi:leucyl/phenylalanyl-tRNA--protein transferase